MHKQNHDTKMIVFGGWRRECSQERQMFQVPEGAKQIESTKMH